MPPQLEKNHVVPTAWQDEALARDGVSREVPCSALKGEPRYMDVFNDTSIHWFPVQKLTQLPMDTWAFREEPDYQDCEDLEIIRKKTEPPCADLSSL